MVELYLKRMLLVFFVGPLATKWHNREPVDPKSPPEDPAAQFGVQGFLPLIPVLPYHSTHHCPLGKQSCLLVHTKEPSSTLAHSSYATLDG